MLSRAVPKGWGPGAVGWGPGAGGWGPGAGGWGPGAVGWGPGAVGWGPGAGGWGPGAVGWGPGAGGWGLGFPPATISVSPGSSTFIRNRRKMEPKVLPTCSCTIPLLLIAYTWQLEILVTALVICI